MRPILAAVAAPLLFGAGAALTKSLLAGVHPVMMAGLLYLSAGLGLAAWRLARRSAEAALERPDLPRLAVVTACGGAIAPALLMLGLASVPASHAALLLNLEAPLTAALASLFFGEHVGRRAWLALAATTLGAAALSGLEGGRATLGPYAAVIGACAFWALDNNLTQRLSEKDPVSVAAAKGAAAGAFNVAAAVGAGAAFPPAGAGAAAAIAGVGFVSYGASLVCYIAALRGLGAARTSLYFSLGPFFGAVLAVALLHEPVTPGLGFAAAAMGLGVWLASGERHEHVHVHDDVHDHLHVHDEHHRHEHEGDAAEPHSHPHSHVGLAHSHPHAPDIHHHH